MKYLVDANVLSEPTKPSPQARVVEWLRTHERDIVVDPVILGEMRYGILLLAKGKKRTALERWFEAGVERLDCLSWDTDTGLQWAELLARLRRVGKAMPIKDSLIAATALVHELTVVTRNTADFAKAGVRTVDPFVAWHAAGASRRNEMARAHIGRPSERTNRPRRRRRVKQKEA